MATWVINPKACTKSSNSKVAFRQSSSSFQSVILVLFPDSSEKIILPPAPDCRHPHKNVADPLNQDYPLHQSPKLVLPEQMRVSLFISQNNTDSRERCSVHHIREAEPWRLFEFPIILIEIFQRSDKQINCSLYIFLVDCLNHLVHIPKRNGQSTGDGSVPAKFLDTGSISTSRRQDLILPYNLLSVRQFFQIPHHPVIRYHAAIHDLDRRAVSQLCHHLMGLRAGYIISNGHIQINSEPGIDVTGSIDRTPQSYLFLNRKDRLQGKG